MEKPDIVCFKFFYNILSIVFERVQWVGLIQIGWFLIMIKKIFYVKAQISAHKHGRQRVKVYVCLLLPQKQLLLLIN